MPEIKQRSVNVIELWGWETDCTICGTPTSMGLYIAMYEGKMVADDYEGEWAGMPVCEKCYKKARNEE